MRSLNKIIFKTSMKAFSRLLSTMTLSLKIVLILGLSFLYSEIWAYSQHNYGAPSKILSGRILQSRVCQYLLMSLSQPYKRQLRWFTFAMTYSKKPSLKRTLWSVWFTWHAITQPHTFWLKAGPQSLSTLCWVRLMSWSHQSTGFTRRQYVIILRC